MFETSNKLNKINLAKMTTSMHLQD